MRSASETSLRQQAPTYEWRGFHDRGSDEKSLGDEATPYGTGGCRFALGDLTVQLAAGVRARS